MDNTNNDQAAQSAAATQSPPLTLDGILQDFRKRIEVLETSHKTEVSPEAIKAAVDNHPLLQQVTTFLGRWGKQTT